MSWVRKRGTGAWDWAPYDGPPERDLVGWVEEAAVRETCRAMSEWFEVRLGWAPEVHLAVLARELPSVEARAACRVAAAARRELNAVELLLVAQRMGFPLEAPAPWPRVVVYAHRVSAHTCWCVGPAHSRGADHCEWNEEHGWRPRPVTEDGA